MNKVKMVCRFCGSTEVYHDAIVAWSIERQCWEVDNVFDNSECLECETSGNWIENEVPLNSDDDVSSGVDL